MLSTSTFPSPESSSDTRAPASWSSSSKLSLSSSPVVVKAEESLRTPDISVLVDVNMFSDSPNSQDFNGGVNPAYITLDHSPLPSLNQILTSPEDVFTSTEFHHYYSNGFTRSLMHIDDHSPKLPQTCDDDSSDDYPPTPVPSRMPFHAPSALPNIAPRPRNPKRKSSTQDVSIKKKKKDEPERIIAFGTPLLDAHRGITQAELEARASRYQQRNPGEDFDKHWLASFSGKLSTTGEMVKEYRCYVVGCTKMNKRPDHMIVHVGSHLDLRPFKCHHCPKRFRRKNELKRHEASRDRSRPFVCPLCPAKTFQRQDLLARHMKNRHQPGKENVPRKKAKTEF
ncbi:hypothetical protein B0H19DRAFT_1177052 [Mycena capillaripes]|nr:hypothetical protein B0H19DRAFT_1177052 [Mycena capillaripes]